jgi:acylphosphatase
MRQVHVTVTGKVQGVGFRAWVQERARGLGLSGWVRNAPDGSVESVLAGPEDMVEEMLTRLKSGPPAARVDAVTPRDHDGDVPEGFAQR